MQAEIIKIPSSAASIRYSGQCCFSAFNIRSRLNSRLLIVLTAPLTETIDHAGYFIQMAMASLPIWMEAA